MFQILLKDFAELSSGAEQLGLSFFQMHRLNDALPSAFIFVEGLNEFFSQSQFFRGTLDDDGIERKSRRDADTFYIRNRLQTASGT